MGQAIPFSGGVKPKLVVYQFRTFLSEVEAYLHEPAFKTEKDLENCRINGGFIPFPSEGVMFLVLPESFQEKGIAWIEE